LYTNFDLQKTFPSGTSENDREQLPGTGVPNNVTGAAFGLLDGALGAIATSLD
jgi:hypothetical protein